MPTQALADLVDTLSDEDVRTECKRMHRYVQKCLGYPPWPISTADRLPEPDKTVLVWRIGTWWRASLDRDGWDFDGENYEPLEAVRYWLPMPPNPEKQPAE